MGIPYVFYIILYYIYSVYIYIYIYIFFKYKNEGSDRPSMKQLNDHVVRNVAVKWRDLGIQLLDESSASTTLDIIEADHKQVSMHAHEL